jgi:hypothetical protein
MDEEIIPAMDEEITPAMDEEIIPAMDEEIIPAMDEEITPAMDDEITEGGQIHSESDPNIGANSTANIPRRSTRNYTPQVPAALTANPKIKEVTQTSPIATAKQSRNKTTRALVTATINSNRSETAPVVAATTAKPNRNGPTRALATTNNDKGGAALRRSGRSQPTKRKINDEALLKKRSRQKHVAALIRRKPLYEIPPESQGLPYLNIVSLKDVHPCWNLLEKLRPENGYTIGQNVRMNVKYGPTCGKIIQMCKPPGGEGIQVLIAKIWERWRIIQDAEGLETFQENLDTHWPAEERSFQYVLGTEYMVISCTDIKAEVQISLSPDLIYHRPYDPEDSNIHLRSAMKKHFSKDGVFHGIKLV